MEGERIPGRLRIAGYVDRRPGRHSAPPEPEETGVQLPRISDYWPDAPHRLQNGDTWQGLLPATVLPATAADPTAPAPRPERFWLQRPVVLTGMTALLVVVGTTLLAQPLADSEIRRSAAGPTPAPTDAIPLEPYTPSPTPTFAAPSPPPVTTSVALPASPSRTTVPAARKARLEFVSGVTALTVRIRDLGGTNFLVTSPDDAPVDATTSFTGGVLLVDVHKIDSGSGAVEVWLSDDITWHLRLAAGVKTLDIDTTGGTVDRIDLDGGAETMRLSLGKLAGVVPVRLTGGVSNWTIRTASRVPARVTVRNGAGNVTLYGNATGGAGSGTVLESAPLGNGPALDIDAASGVGSLAVTTHR